MHFSRAANISNFSSDRAVLLERRGSLIILANGTEASAEMSSFSVIVNESRNMHNALLPALYFQKKEISVAECVANFVPREKYIVYYPKTVIKHNYAYPY